MATGIITVNNIVNNTSKSLTTSTSNNDDYLVGFLDEDNVIIDTTSPLSLVINDDRNITAFYDKKCLDCEVYNINGVDDGYEAEFIIYDGNGYSNTINVNQNSLFPVYFTKCDDENISLIVTTDQNSTPVPKSFLYVDYSLSNCLTCSDEDREPVFDCIDQDPVGEGEQDNDCSSGMDLLFILDKTGSMGNALNALKTGITEIVGDITKKTNSYRLGLTTVGEGIFNFDFVRIIVDFASNNSSDFNKKIKGIKVGGGGNDNAEPMGRGLEKSINDNGLVFTNSSKIIIIITDNKVNDSTKLIPSLSYCNTNNIYPYTMVLSSAGNIIDSWKSHYNDSSFGVAGGDKYVLTSPNTSEGLKNKISELLLGTFCK